MSAASHPRSDLAAIRRLATDHARRLGLANVEIFDRPQGNGSPYVEIADTYHFVVEERGVELERRTTPDFDELLYWLFDGVTFSLATAFELHHRRPNEDTRRQLFDKQKQLLGQISPYWAARKADDHRNTLSRYPFNDALG